MTPCHHPYGYTKKRCHCGLYFLHCPRCEPNMRYCETCAADVRNFKRRNPHARTPRPRPYWKTYYIKHREDLLAKRKTDRATPKEATCSSDSSRSSEGPRPSAPAPSQTPT